MKGVRRRLLVPVLAVLVPVALALGVYLGGHPRVLPDALRDALVGDSDAQVYDEVVERIGDDFYRVLVRFGFMEVPDVPLALMRSCDMGEAIGIPIDPMDTTYFASRETVVAGRHRGMPIWRSA